MDASSVPAWAWIVGSGGLAGVLGAVAKGLGWFSSREGRHVKTLGDTIDILAAQQEQFAKDLVDTRKAITECHENHRKCEEGRDADREAHRRQSEAFRREIEALKAMMTTEPPADYLPEDLRRITPAKKRVG